MTFIARTQRAGLPVSFSRKAVTVGHKALNGQAGKLLETVQVLKVRRESLEIPLFEEGPEAEFYPGSVSQRFMSWPTLAERRGDGVALFIFRAQGVNPGVADGC